MLDGWYCRSINEQAQQAQQQQQQQQQMQQQHQEPQPHSSSHPTAAAIRNNLANNGNSSDGEDLGGPDGGDSTDQTDPDSDEDVMPTRRNIDYKAQYNELKKKLKYLLYENEFFQENLRTSQRRLLKITRDRSFLLDRLLQYEKVDVTSSEDEDTESSDDSSKADPVPTVGRKRKNEPASVGSSQSQNKNPPKRRKPGPKKQQQLAQQSLLQQRQFQASLPHGHQQQNQHHHQDGHLTAEEVERHLQSRAQAMSLVPEGELPNEMFSQNPSSESNDPMVDTSPSNIGEECLSTDMNMMQQE